VIGPRALAVALALPTLVSLLPARAQAQTPAPAPATPNVSWKLDGAITVAALVGAQLVSLLPVDQTTLWKKELLPFDTHLQGRMSNTASETSDVLAAVDVFTPVPLLFGQAGGLNEASGRRLLVFAETLAVSHLLNATAKYLVGRPRPHVYSTDPRIQRYAKDEGKDSYLSFYSGHASLTFAASVAGSYLFSQASSDARSRAAVWGFELTLAGAATRLRTRAGKHFYSDVIVGFIMGTAVGFAVPRLHGGPAYHPTGGEWAVMAAAPLVGVAIAQLLPAPPDVLEPLASVALPFVTPGGGGIMLTRAF
jgi:membrane-associated phospholipid phosphatase